MYDFIEKNKLLHSKQFGFRHNHSTTHALISLTESIKHHLDDKKKVAGIFIDLEKAFDTVNHKILCEKLKYYGFRGKINELINSFLSNRQQYVHLNGFDSIKLNTNCGVPQGSTLGPPLFLLYINDLRFCLKYVEASHFADDTCLVYASNKNKSLETNLNYDLKHLIEWLNANRLSLNVKKTKLLIFHSKYDKSNLKDIFIKIQGQPLKSSQYIKYLGVYIDDTLSWNKHINELNLLNLAKLMEFYQNLGTLFQNQP